MKVKNSTRFTIFFDQNKIDPDNITANLSLNPTEILFSQDKIINGKIYKRPKISMWRLVHDFDDYPNMYKHLNHFVNILESGNLSLAEIAEQYQTRLTHVLEIYGEGKEVIHIEPSILKKLVDLNVHLDIDLYVFNEVKPEKCYDNPTELEMESWTSVYLLLRTNAEIDSSRVKFEDFDICLHNKNNVLEYSFRLKSRDFLMSFPEYQRLDQESDYILNRIDSDFLDFCQSYKENKSELVFDIYSYGGDRPAIGADISILKKLVELDLGIMINLNTEF